MRARPLGNWPRVCCASESPLPVVCTFDSRTSCGHFFIAVAFIVFFGNKLLSAKYVRTTVKWLQIVTLQKISRRKCDCFLCLLSCQTTCFLEFLSPKFNSNYYYGRENQNNSACQSNQALIANFTEDIDFMSSVHF